jgi:hypothetical protein
VAQLIERALVRAATVDPGSLLAGPARRKTSPASSPQLTIR